MKKTFQLIFSFVLVAAIGYILWLILGYLFHTLIGLGKEVTAAAITALLGLFGILYVQWNSKAKQIADSHRPAKIEVYETFFDIVEKFMTNDNTENLDPESEDFPEELRKQFMKLSRGMIVWASPQVIKAWSKFREEAGSRTPADTLLAVDEVLQAIRKDLGNSNFGLSRGDVVKLYLKNPSEVDV
ncbi:hypothetical protein KJ870_10265 [bacterium]|nr:hypothetical protein [bacterium]MBU1435310.1 hypothetical protein [bacterium]MBU1503508.1 hypothetical protein [bacterium]